MCREFDYENRHSQTIFRSRDHFRIVQDHSRSRTKTPENEEAETLIVFLPGYYDLVSLLLFIFLSLSARYTVPTLSTNERNRSRRH